MGSGGPRKIYRVIEHIALYLSVEGNNNNNKKGKHPPLSLFVPQAQLSLRNVVGEVVTFAAALYATLVAGGFARAVPVAAVLQQTGVPFQTQAVCAQAGLPHVLCRVTSLEAGRLRGYGQHLEHGTIHSCNTGQQRGFNFIIFFNLLFSVRTGITKRKPSHKVHVNHSWT